MRRALHSVKARLCLGLGLIILLLVAIGLQGVLSNRQTQAAMHAIVENNVQSMIDLTIVRSSISDNRTIFALSGNGELSAEQRQKIDANRKLADAAWGRYYPALISSDEQRTVATNFIKALEVQRSLLDSGQAEESAIRQSYTHVYDSITALYSSEQAETQAAYQQSVKNYQSSRTLIIGVILVALLIAIAIGWWLARGILRPLKEATDFSTALAEGNLGVRLSTRYRDEFGRMLDAMAAMRDKLTGVIAEVANNARTVESISGELVASNENLSQRTQEQA
uniref:MCP four helix bundle domain-containing protein n=1 Tax=Salinicola endophyticus TaxID=1949083 RepID=UPI00165ED55C